MSERRAALKEAADYAEFYAEERMRLCGDSILHDPILRGGAVTRENMARSVDRQLDGTINSAAYHAASDIAEHLRNIADSPPLTKPQKVAFAYWRQKWRWLCGGARADLTNAFAAGWLAGHADADAYHAARQERRR